MAEVIRCSECNTVFKGVPAWLTTAKVNFACTSCPKKGTRGATLTRFEPMPETRPSIDLDSDDVDIEVLDEDVEMDLGDEDLEALGDDKDL